MKGVTALSIFVIGAGAVTLAFAALVLTQVLREFMHAGLEGSKFVHFYWLFVPTLWIILSAIVNVSKGKPATNQILFWVVSGAFAGYVSGVISAALIEVFRPNGAREVLEQSLHATNWLVRLGYPLISLNWLVGVMAGVFEFCFFRYAHPARAD